MNAAMTKKVLDAQEEQVQQERAARLKLARNTILNGKFSGRGMSAAARHFGYTKDTYAQHENGHRGIDKAGPQYAMDFGISLDWLMNGVGEMLPTPSQAQIIDAFSTPDGAAAKEANSLNKRINNLLSQADDLNEAAKVGMINVMEGYLSSLKANADPKPAQPSRSKSRD